jgi:4-amino-4-deoxy-L-arabinose transferase-like glycosyltransferase
MSDSPDARPRSQSAIISLILAASLLSRLPLVLDPARAVVGWRQSDLASVARNFYEHGHSLLYPQIDWGGAGPGFVEMELPLVPWALGWLYRLTGGVHESLAGVLPALAAIVAALATYALGRRLFGEVAAGGAGVLVAISPAFAGASQSLLSDPPMVAGSVLGLYAFLRWTDAGDGDGQRDGQGVGWYLLAAVSIAIAILLKPTAALIGLPLAWLAWLRFGRSVWRRQPFLWLFAILTLAPALLWYWHAHALGATYGNTFGVIGSGYSKFTHPDLLLAREFYTRLTWRIAVYLMTPIGLLLFALGLFRRPRQPIAWLAHIWILACALYVAAIAEGNHQMIHYQLPLLPPMALLAGWGLDGVVAWIRQKLTGIPLGARAALAAMAVVLFASSVLAADYVYYTRADPSTLNRVMRERGQAVGQALRADALIIYVTADFGNASLSGSASGAAMPRGSHMTPPDVFYFSGHRGWYLAIPWVTAQEIQTMQRAGAKYLVVSSYMGDEVEEFRRGKPEIFALLRTQYAQVLDRPDLVAFDLTQPTRSE